MRTSTCAATSMAWNCVRAWASGSVITTIADRIKRSVTPRRRKCIAPRNRMERNLRVGLEVRPPVVGKKNPPKKPGGGKRCHGILAAFEISERAEKRGLAEPSVSARLARLNFGGGSRQNRV